MRKLERWEIEKIAERQCEAIARYGFLTYAQLCAFLAKAENDRKLVNGYFNCSKGWSTEEQRRAISRELADYILANL